MDSISKINKNLFIRILNFAVLNTNTMTGITVAKGEEPGPKISHSTSIIVLAAGSAIEIDEIKVGETGTRRPAMYHWQR